MGDNSGQREGISRSGAWARARVHAAKRATADQRGRSATDSGIPEQPLQIRIHRPAGQARVDQTGRPVLHGWHQGGPGNVTRICFIGGGSYNWMPKLLGDLALTPDLSGEIVLHDISTAALEDIQRYGRKVIAHTGARFTIDTTTNLDEGLRGAEFVVVTITTGGLDTMAIDIDLPKKYGICRSAIRSGPAGCRERSATSRSWPRSRARWAASVPKRGC